MTEAVIKKVNDLLGTSCDDCRSSLQFIYDLGTLEAALREAVSRELHTKAKLIMTRIRQIRKARAA